MFDDTTNVKLSYEGVYKIDNKAEVVYSAEIPSGAENVYFYCTDNPNFCSNSTSITVDYVYCADKDTTAIWNNEYLSNGKFNLSNDGVLTGKTKYRTP